MVGVVVRVGVGADAETRTEVAVKVAHPTDSYNPTISDIEQCRNITFRKMIEIHTDPDDR